ncbi:MAG: hypothetical protein LBF37_01790, partial [Rickettsiales bacterium]|nr:hypothetical protein [Rickettsiales bacterium]
QDNAVRAGTEIRKLASGAACAVACRGSGISLRASVFCGSSRTIGACDAGRGIAGAAYVTHLVSGC